MDGRSSLPRRPFDCPGWLGRGGRFGHHRVQANRDLAIPLHGLAGFGRDVVFQQLSLAARAKEGARRGWTRGLATLCFIWVAAERGSGVKHATTSPAQISLAAASGW